MLRCSLILLLSLLWPIASSAQEDLNIVSWGGPYENAQSQAFFTPFSKEHDVPVSTFVYSGEPDALETRAAAEGWDVVDMLEDQAIADCASGYLLELDHAALGLRKSDFSPVPIRRCSVPQNVYAVVFAFNDRAFSGAKPTKIDDFFDVDKFPGKRAIARSPDAILEWALLAEGVPPEQIYDLLSTDRGLRLAFRKLDQIRDHIIWWETPAQSAEFLKSGAAAFSSGYNGRFFTLSNEENAPVSIVWDGRLVGYDVWAIPATSKNINNAKRFLTFASDPKRMAKLAELMPYGPTRPAAFEYVGLNPTTGIQMRDHLPNAPSHGGRVLAMDSVWYANTADLRQRRFLQWLGDGELGAPD